MRFSPLLVRIAIIVGLVVAAAQGYEFVFAQGAGSASVVFCTRSALNQQPIKQVEITLLSSLVARSSPDYPYLFTRPQSNGISCTNPSHLNYEELEQHRGETLALEAKKANYQTKNITWPYQGQPDQKIFIDLTSSEVSGTGLLTNVSKEASRLHSDETTTQVAIGFRVAGEGTSVDGVTIHERFQSGMAFTALQTISLVRLGTGGSLSLSPEAGWDSTHFSVTIPEPLTEGDYQLRFDLDYSGPVGNTIAIDQASPTISTTCADLAKNNYAFISYSSGTSKFCASIPQGVLEKDSADTSIPVVRVEGKFIGQTISFPKQEGLKSDITIAGSEAVKRNPPPLFSQFYLPLGEEIP